ncbi:MAG TPA: hypothetical protein PLQ31_03415 [Thermoanaerobaculia bacterium]|nr:hypothetical protein [Thermoanaerobaculia bacterium]HQN38568.1 hypothetical protein [Thermoanaerobaculia bacterium]
MRTLLCLTLLLPLFGASFAFGATAPAPGLPAAAVDNAVARLVALHGEAHAARARLGAAQVAARWWPEDGDEAAYLAFCEAQFLTDEADLTAAAERLSRVLEEMTGRLHEIRREQLTPLDLDTGPVRPWDELFVQVDLDTHLLADLFASKVAFFALLNYPVRSLAEMLAEGPEWSRETWARARLMEQFATRIPQPVLQRASEAMTAADQYIAGYNIRMDRLVTADGQRPFPEGLRLISHWGLRDELGSRYADPEGLARQRLIAAVMERIVRQEIPAAVIDNPDLLWDPVANRVQPLAGGEAVASAPEPDRRYEQILSVFRAVAAADPFAPDTPSWIRRQFERNRQIPEAEFERLLVSVLAAPEVKLVGAEAARRLGRPLEPFDIWYSGFKPRGRYGEAELDQLTRARYPTVAAVQADLPRLLRDLGFTPERAEWIAARVVVDPSRGAGHAMGAVRRGDQAHLRTRVAAGGMDYKGYNIAVHEFGHNVEQVFSLDGIDYWPLSGVPNNAFTEAFAFTFQHRDLELLGLGSEDAANRHARALADLWATYEIAGVSLVDMRMWRWLYAHPEATAAELRQATVTIAQEVWNEYFAPVFGVRDSVLLGIYSHMVGYPLYLPDYALGHLIAFQIAEHLHGRDFGAEFERMARQGRLTPDAWMRGAVGSPPSAEPLLAVVREALADLGGES